MDTNMEYIFLSLVLFGGPAVTYALIPGQWGVTFLIGLTLGLSWGIWKSQVMSKVLKAQKAMLRHLRPDFHQQATACYFLAFLFITLSGLGVWSAWFHPALLAKTRWMGSGMMLVSGALLGTTPHLLTYARKASKS